MHRFVILVSILALALVGPGWIGSAPIAAAQEGTPAATRCPEPSATPAAEPAASPMATSSEEPVCIGVIEGEYFVRPERTTFRVGETYIFAVRNVGTVVHEFVIEPAASAEEAALEAEIDGEEREGEIEDLAPGQTAELEWVFSEPGRFQFACHIADHYEQGMVVEIEVVS